MEVKILKNYFKKKSMSLGKKIKDINKKIADVCKDIWNKLGPDIPDDISSPELDLAFSEADARISSLESKYFFSTNNKAGKGGKTSKEVDAIKVDTTNLKHEEKNAKTSNVKANEDKEIER